MAQLEIAPETFEAAARVKVLRAQLKAAKAEVNRLDAELQDAIDTFTPLKASAISAFLQALGEPEGTDGLKPLPKPRPPPVFRGTDPPKAA